MEWFSGGCGVDPVCYAVDAVVGSPSDGVYAPCGAPVTFLADWFAEFRELPLVDGELCRWVAAVSLVLPDHNDPSSIGLAVSVSDSGAMPWRVHIVMKHYEEFGVLGVNVLTVLCMWLADMWGAAHAEINYLSHSEWVVITFFFDSFRDMPKPLRELLQYAGYSLRDVPNDILKGRTSKALNIVGV